MSDRLKIGITNTSYGAYGFSESFEKISEDGYECIDYQQLADISTEFFNSEKGEFEAVLKEHRALIESHGMRVTQAHGPWPFPENHGDGEGYERLVEASRRAVYGAHVLGSPRLVVHPLTPFGWGGDNPEEVYAINEKFLRDLADYAAPLGVCICLENLPFAEYPLGSVEAVCDMVDRIAMPNLKVCLDTGHAVIFNKDVASQVKYIGSRLEALHIHDNMGESDEHLIPGDGIILWDEFSDALREIGYKNVISLETGPKLGDFPKSRWEERRRLLFDIAKGIAERAVKA